MQAIWWRFRSRSERGIYVRAAKWLRSRGINVGWEARPDRWPLVYYHITSWHPLARLWQRLTRQEGIR